MAQLNDLLVMGQSTLLGPVNIHGQTTLAGVLKLANNTWNYAGDDVYFGDNNTAGSFAIKGINGTTNLKMVQHDGTDYGTLSWDGSKFTLSHTLNGNLNGNASSANRLVSRGHVEMETGTNVPAVAGLSMSQVYNNTKHPTAYGNLMTMYGIGASQLLIGWSGTSGATAPAYIRSKRDVAEAEWSDWQQLATTDMIATSSNAGLVKIGYTQTDKNYPVQLSSSNQMYVNVPWTNSNDNTTYTFATGDGQGQLKITPSGGSASNYNIKDLTVTSTPTFAAIKIGANGMIGTGSTINSLICESAINTYIGADAQAVWLGSRGNTENTETSGVCFDGGTIKFWCPGDSNVLFIDSDSTTTLNYVGITAASYNATSDKRLKTNIQPLEFQKSILDLPIYKFDFIKGANNQIGCMAQDLQEICPEIVNEDEHGYLSIQESKLIYLLIDEIKKLKNEINQLKCERSL